MGLAALLAAPLSAEAPPRPRPAPEGEVCGDPALIGAAVAAIAGGGGCGVAAPVRISAAAGVGLEPPAIVTCATARTLAAWLGGDAVPAFSARGAGLEALEVVDGYACRNRNRAATGKISEHARGRAIDIGGFRLGDGTVGDRARGLGLGGVGQDVAASAQFGLRAFRHRARPGGERAARRPSALRHGGAPVGAVVRVRRDPAEGLGSRSKPVVPKVYGDLLWLESGWKVAGKWLAAF